VLTADLGRVQSVRESRLRMEYAQRPYDLTIEGSADGRSWRPLAQRPAASGSPIVLTHPAKVRFLRLHVPDGAGVWEWDVF
jgi:hypothetical protein